ncbi:hypothetical protein [Rhodoferax ferrireducens]|uniref:hypothetical protein n=1 Tax=Rhodoferax ferrireducens TaxID=192843 RepID=UPI000E0DC678|nr:hypothetical protein [Rhodoferax ferrireducens]
MQIKPLHQATRADVTALAHAAAERDEPSEQANPFEPGTPNHRAFAVDYYQHMLAGESVEVAA